MLMVKVLVFKVCQNGEVRQPLALLKRFGLNVHGGCSVVINGSRKDVEKEGPERNESCPV
jgi:hypothetical protein